MRRTLESLLDDLYAADDFTVTGSYEAGEKLLEIAVTAPSDQDINEAMLGVFYDVFFCLPLDTSLSHQYRFRWTSVSDGKAVDTYVLGTDVRFLPETGGVTRHDWAAFTQQLDFTHNGQAVEMPAPDEFIDD